MPAISIITPVYNAEKYLRQAIESVMAQTFQDWELILVDDGSTDKSNEICREYAIKDRRIRIIEKANGGVSCARNTALDVSEGEYIFFLDADDELYPYSIKHLHNIAQSYSVPIAAGREVYATEKPEKNLTATTEPEIVKAEHFLKNVWYQKKHTDNSVSWKLFKKFLFDNLRFYDGRFEDLEIFHKILFKADTIAISDSVVYFYRKHPTSFINSWSERRKGIVKVTESIINRMQNNYPTLVKAAEHRHFSASYNLLIALINNTPDDKDAIEKNFATIKSLRKQIIMDPNSRMKNRVGAMMSFLGMKSLSKLIKWTIK
ncbi:MAG: glycosyltransferase [Muribaculaceae bacterium]|nr:glycosyltransferase [Muribaculaceae bacterium]